MSHPPPSRARRADGRPARRAAPRRPQPDQGAPASRRRARQPATGGPGRGARRGAPGSDHDGRLRPTRRGGSAAGRIGAVLCVMGLLLGLYTAYSLWGTDYVANQAAQSASSDLRKDWQQQRATGNAPPRPLPGDAIGFLYAPRMSKSPILVRPGTADEVLDQGVAGAYEHAAMPWEKTGNFALAAHRDGHGAKFHHMDRLRRGDTLVVETRDTWYVYKLDRTLPKTSIDNTGIIEPVPKGSGYSKPGRYITLTTCTPKYTSDYRMAVWGHLVRTAPVDAARTLPAELR
ncbi:class E sortase [Streptomyces sp. NPDC086023]|uniref:class E sortase n=1 Tax=Streptomyces sp. NPDC086023 TaxID=3365746 RepID=UPI0037D4D7FE